MIVCVCLRVSDRDIRRHAQDGCHSFDELQMATGVSTSCGRCETCAKETFQRAHAAEESTCFVHKDLPVTG
jgi:bacterioferritin-associated ferredoxin